MTLADQKIGKTAEKPTVEVLHTAQDAVERGIQFMRAVNEKMDIYFGSKGASIVVGVDAYRNGYIDIRRRGARIRALTEITKDNLRYCKELMKIVDELRHLDGIQGGVAISESEYMATTVLQKAEPLTEVIYSNIGQVVRQGQYIFDTLWHGAIPAKQRIEEIEKGTKREFTETIYDPAEIQKIAIDLVESATDEILIIFSTGNSLRRQEKIGAYQLLKKAAARGVKIRILVPFIAEIDRTIQELRKLQIEVRDNKDPLQGKPTTLIVDRAFSLAVELKDDSKENSNEAMGVAMYSNNEPTVLAFISIFETRWMKGLAPANLAID